MRIKILLLIAMVSFFPLKVWSEAIPGYFDMNGNLMHSGDEFSLHVAVQVQKVAQGYRYSYSLASDPASAQNIFAFSITLQPDAIVAGSSSTPWDLDSKSEPTLLDDMPSMAWVALPEVGNPDLIVPGEKVRGFSFVSLYPPGVVEGYAEGMTELPRFDPKYPDGHPLYWGRTPYGPGKVFPVIGPVKAVITGGSNYSVLNCTGVRCSVQLDATGPQDPLGNTYTYNWSGAFGTAIGIKPTVVLHVGTHQVQLSISDAAGAVLATASMDIVVANPNPVPGGKGQAIGGAGKPSGGSPNPANSDRNDKGRDDGDSDSDEGDDNKGDGVEKGDN